MAIREFELMLADCRLAHIRRPRPEEFPAIQWLRYGELDNLLGLPFDVQEDKAKDSLPDTLHVVTFNEDVVLGTLRIEPDGEGGAAVRRMAVAERVRKQKIGESMLQFAQLLAKDEGVDHFTLRARPEIPPHFDDTRRFFEKCGFVATGEFVTNEHGDYPLMVKHFSA